MLSDSLPEAVNKDNEMYDYDRIKSFILENVTKSAEEIKDLLLKEWICGWVV